MFFSFSLSDFIFFSGHITSFSSQYSKSTLLIVVFPSLAALSAASLITFSISAPTNQLVRLAKESMFTVSSALLLLRWYFVIRTLSSSVGLHINTFLSNLPDLINAGSRVSGLLVAATTIILVSLSNQSISVRI
jgi:hypothetical protein